MKKFLTTVFILLLSACIPLAAAFAAPQENASENTRPFLPATYEEYCELTQLMDVYYDEGMTVLSEKDKIWVSRGSGFTAFETTQKNVKMARRFGNDVLVQDDMILYRYSPANGASEQLNDTEGNVINGNNFALNDRYLAITTNANVKIYEITPAGFAPYLTIPTAAGRDNIPLCITETGDLFYHIKSTGILYQLNLDTNREEVYSLRGSGEEMTAMHVRDGNVYYIMNTAVARFNLESKTNETILAAANGRKMGATHTPISLTFRGENLLVADTGLNAVQEFAPDSDGIWRYTGFSITGENAGENRISGATDAAYADGNVYLLDGNGEILIVGSGGAQTDYRRVNLGAKLTFTPVKLETDGSSVLLAGVTEAAFYRIETDELIPANFTQSMIYDVSYANGVYYLLGGDRVVAYDAESFNPTNLVTALTVGEKSLIAADVDNNLFLYNSSDQIVTRYDRSGDRSGTAYNLPEAALSLGADLNGNLFALAANNNVYSFKDGKTTATALKTRLPAANARSMCMAFDSKEVWFVYENAGYVLTCAQLNNDSITSVTAPALTLTARTRADGDLTLRTVNEGENLYEMDFPSDLTFPYRAHLHAEGTTEYVKIAETQGFEVLLLDETIYLAKARHVSAVDRQTTPVEQTKAYVITSAYLYYYPMIEPIYQLTDMKKMEAQTKIALLGELTFNDRAFCYVEWTEGTETVRGFLLKNFTTERYSGIYDGETFSDGTKQPGAEYALRNAIVFILVGLSVCATSVYFVLRRRRKIPD